MSRSKSHDPVSPNPHKRPPPWLDKAFRATLQTDDTDFGLVHILPDGGVLLTAWQDGNGRWRDTKVQKGRVTCLQRLS